MGFVLLAEDLQLARPVAVKVVWPDRQTAEHGASLAAGCIAGEAIVFLFVCALMYFGVVGG